LDFAYRVHTEVGHRCRGAKVNGRIMPLTYALQTGQQVEILTSPNAEPSRDWLRSSQGYLRTSRARAKVRHWFKQRDRELNIASGRSLLERELKRLALPKSDYDQIAASLDFKDSDEMLAALGAGDIGTGSVIRAAQAQHEAETTQDNEQAYKALRPASKRDDSSTDINVSGTGNMLTHIANCCKPVPGEPIVGYVTQGRGVSIHREDCAQLLNLHKTEPERMINVSWGGESSSTYPVDVAIHAYDRPGLLRDITALLANENVNVLAVNTQSNKSDSTADMRLTIEVTSIEWLGRLLARVSQLPNVITANRAHS
jgi:GTP pyrophosphokinase